MKGCKELTGRLQSQIWKIGGNLGRPGSWHHHQVHDWEIIWHGHHHHGRDTTLPSLTSKRPTVLLSQLLWIISNLWICLTSFSEDSKWIFGGGQVDKTRSYVMFWLLGGRECIFLRYIPGWELLNSNILVLKMRRLRPREKLPDWNNTQCVNKNGEGARTNPRALGLLLFLSAKGNFLSLFLSKKAHYTSVV